MTTELFYLLASTLLTALIRIPWMINKVTVRGLTKVVSYPSDSEPLSEWAKRLWFAHRDALDNLVIFTALVVLVHLVDAYSALTAIAAAAYFWSRLVHAVVYALAWPWIKTASYLVSFAAQLLLAWELFT